MDKRLLSIASHVKNGRGVVDVGTDHGFLPIYLALNGYKGNIFATDINSEPLLTGIENAKEAGLADKIEFILCDGLEKCPYTKIDTLIIAGMGGDTMCGILDRAEWLYQWPYKLILQPMTKAEILRYWLSNNGFEIKTEELVEDAGNLYQIMTAAAGYERKLNDAELLTGKFELISRSEYFPKRLDKLIKAYEKSVFGMKECQRADVISRRGLNQKILKELREMKAVLSGEYNDDRK